MQWTSGPVQNMTGTSDVHIQCRAEIERLRAEKIEWSDLATKESQENERLRAAGSTLASYVYSIANPGAVPQTVKDALAALGHYKE